MSKTESGYLFTALQRYERAVSPRLYAKESASWFDRINGRRPVLVSAPHACRHIRDGVEKMGEEYTAAIAQYLAAETGCHAIYTTHKTIEDPNWVAVGDYKEAIAEMVRQHDIHFVIDIHGMVNRHHIGVALGTMLGRSIGGMDVVRPFIDAGFKQVSTDDLPEKLFSQDGLPIDSSLGAGENDHWRRLVVDHPGFTGGIKSHTVTRYVCEELGVNSVQVELASVARIVNRTKTKDWPYEYAGKRCAITASVDALCALIEAVS